MKPLHFSIQIERGWSQPTQITSEMYKSLHKVLQATQACKKLREVQYRKKAFMIDLILICMGICNVHRLMNDQDITWMSQVSGLRKELFPSLPKAQPTQSLGESPAPCLLVSWSEMAPLRPEDFELILPGVSGELISSLVSCLCVVGCGLLPES